MKKIVALGLAFLVSLSCLSPTEVAASTSITNTEDFYSQVEVLDGDGQQIPYTVEEIKQMVHLEPENNNVMVPFAIKGENYGPMTFARMFYIGSGTYGKA